jgi:hypothetical protein
MTRNQRLTLTFTIILCLVIIALSMLLADYTTLTMSDAELHNWIAGATWTPAP